TPAVELDAPDASLLAVGDEQARAVSGQAARLRERTERAGPVHDVFKSIARPGGELVRLQIERPDLMMPGHRDEQRVFVEKQIPRAVQADAERRASLADVFALLAGAGNRLDRSRLEVQSADEVILAIGHIKSVTAQGQTLRIA